MTTNLDFMNAKGWLLEAERLFLHNAARDAATILNIGIEYGASLHCLRSGNPAARIIAIDIIGDAQALTSPSIAGMPARAASGSSCRTSARCGYSRE